MKAKAKVKIYTKTVGQCFGTVACVKVGRKVVHVTRTFPYSFTAPALAAAEQWATEHGIC